MPYILLYHSLIIPLLYINELIITYEDRLARFGYEMIENIIRKYSNRKIIILNKNEGDAPIYELVKDVVSIMNVYVAKINGLKKNATKLKKDILKYKNNSS